MADRLPAALWPVAGKPVLVRLLRHLADEGVQEVAICCDQAVADLVEAGEIDDRLEIRYVVEELSSGTAGCLRDAAGADPGDLTVVFSGAMLCPPSIESLIEADETRGADLTMVFNPGQQGGSDRGRPAEIYLCRPGVLKHIPAGGYSDIKEGLIPAILRAGGAVRPMVLARDAGNFHDRASYLAALSVCLSAGAAPSNEYRFYEGSNKRIPPDTLNENIHPGARVYGPVAVADRARVLKGALIIGPALIGAETVIGEDAAIVRSAVWDGCRVGARCEIRESLIDCGTVIPEGMMVVQQSLSPGTGTKAVTLEGQMTRNAESHIEAVGRAGPSRPEGLAEKMPARVPLSPKQMLGALGGLAVLLAFLWSYWPTLTHLWEIWHRSDEYSAGLLVPLLTVYILWSRRRELVSVPVRPAVVWGSAAFAAAQAARGVGLYFMYGSGEILSIVLSVAALVLLLLGWRFLAKLAPVLLFLCLMLPWPHRVQAAVSLPLQRYATDSAVFCLELLGYGVVQDGNVIRIGETSVAVAEACNGLRMVTAFLVITGLVVLLARRAWWEKLIVLISSLPIALLCNTIRLTVTAIAFTILTGDQWEQLFHDFGGYAMMPLALAMTVGELWLLRLLTTPKTEVQREVIVRRKTRGAMDS
ncbi:MAG: exosortase [Sedimentisphaerales bacterium]|nr:exosortase [Sedimentisphaerales bacterium]